MPSAPDRKFDAVLLDIDHSPEHFLGPGNKSFYTAEGLASVRNQLKPNGCFALWSNDPASEDFTEHLRQVFGSATASQNRISKSVHQLNIRQFRLRRPKNWISGTIRYMQHFFTS